VRNSLLSEDSSSATHGVEGSLTANVAFAIAQFRFDVAFLGINWCFTTEITNICPNVRPTRSLTVVACTHSDNRVSRVFRGFNVFICLSVCLSVFVYWLVRSFICLSLCLFFHTISQKPMQLGSTNLIWKYFVTSPGNLFVLESTGQRPRSSCTKCIDGVGNGTPLIACLFLFFSTYKVWAVQLVATLCHMPTGTLQ